MTSIRPLDVLIDSAYPPSLLKCSACDKEAPSLLHCAACKLAYYDSKECQRADWKRHKKECQETVIELAVAKEEILAPLAGQDLKEFWDHNEFAFTLALISSWQAWTDEARASLKEQVTVVHMLEVVQSQGKVISLLADCRARDLPGKPLLYDRIERVPLTQAEERYPGCEKRFALSSAFLKKKKSEDHLAFVVVLACGDVSFTFAQHISPTDLNALKGALENHLAAGKDVDGFLNRAVERRKDEPRVRVE